MNHVASLFPALVVSTLAGACAPSLQLITPQQAQEKVYDHLSRAEAYRLTNKVKLASIERQKARAYKQLIRERHTTTPEQALAAAARHRHLAEAYREMGYTRFVKGELEKAAAYENFALRNGAITRPAVDGRPPPSLRRSGASAQRVP